MMRLFGVGPGLGFQLKSDYEGAQAAFKSASPDKIYIDINAGLMSGKDVSDLAKYAMLRTFSHEFIHFVEYWNPVQYNVLRKLVFDEITARGENVNDLIESKMDSTGLSYEKASREVVAETMTDILPDRKFGKDEVGGSNPPSSSKTETTRQGGFLFWQAALRSRSLSP